MLFNEFTNDVEFSGNGIQTCKKTRSRKGI